LSRFATGKHAYGISDRSGFRYRLKDMRKEWNGSLVGKDEYESKHPQLTPRLRVVDAQALRNARPDTNNIFNVDVSFPIFNIETLKYELSLTSGTGQVGTVTFGGTVISATSITASPDGVVGTTTLGNETASGTVIAATYAVTVANPGAGNRYYIDSSLQATVNLSEGSIYRFDQSDSSNSGHPLRFSTTSNGTHSSGSEYTTGVTTNGTPGSSGAYTQITVASSAPTLYYYCTNHSGMGGTANTP
jgi:hypothetical protein|tara:strand:- start:425 stop:1162 length:738 start_codon:yes stop_codon:yes gene_type:complete